MNERQRSRRIRPNQGGSPREGATKVTIRSKSSKASATTYSSRNDKGTPESKAFQSIRFGKRYANQSSSQSKTGKAKQTGNDTSTISSRKRFENSSNFLQCKSSSSTNPKARAEIVNDYLRGTQRERSLCQHNGLSKESWHSEHSCSINHIKK